MLKATLAMLIVMGTLLLGAGVASAGTVTSERVIFGEPYGTVRLDAGRDFTIDPITSAFVPLKSFDQMCVDARELPGRVRNYDTYVNGPFQLWSENYYITCTN